jgi:catechol 2,3-dioxygenase-like lactoylglutathione lyase family enzyme
MSKLTRAADAFGVAGPVARPFSPETRLSPGFLGFISAICGDPEHTRTTTTMIQHVTRPIRPSELDDCVRFYGLLGFEQIAVPPGIQGRAVWLAQRANGPSGPDLHLQFTERPDPEQGHVAFVVERYEQTLEDLRQAGFEVDPRREHWGSPRAYVRDPASHLVELMAQAPDERRQ